MVLFLQQHWQEVTGAIFGLLYLYLEYKADIKMWPVGIIMSLFYVYVFVTAKFYAFATINVYYIIAQVHGWISWKKAAQSNMELKHIKKKQYFSLSGVAVLLMLLIAFVLIKLGDSPVVWADSFITGLSIVAIWMLTRKYVEQWIPLIIANFTSVFVFAWQALYPTSIMYLIYAVVSIFGYRNWKKMAKNTRQ